MRVEQAMAGVLAYGGEGAKPEPAKPKPEPAKEAGDKAEKPGEADKPAK